MDFDAGVLGGNGVPAGVFGLFEADAGEEGCGGFFWMVCKIESHHVRSRHRSSWVPLVCSVLGRKSCGQVAGGRSHLTMASDHQSSWRMCGN